MGSDRVMLSLADHEVLLVPAQFPTIQGAIDAVTRPATVVVEPGAIGPVDAFRGTQATTRMVRWRTRSM